MVQDNARPNCTICQYLKHNPEIKKRVLATSYFSPAGTESLLVVFREAGVEFPASSIYSHAQRHEQNALARARRQYLKSEASTAIVLPAVTKHSDSDYQGSLNEFIAAGRIKLANNDLRITASTYLTAIRIKADTNNADAERKIEMLKTIFAGASPHSKDDKNLN